jgi:VIT1/CCC1 family predicted Fe2+/Mn2+ transporter
MSVGYWIVAGVTAFAFLGTGLLKLTSSRAKLLASKNGGWVSGFTEAQVKLIGLAELLGAAGLILPPAVGTAKWLRVPAALGLLVLMLGASNTHRTRKESPALPLVLGILAVVTIFL